MQCRHCYFGRPVGNSPEIMPWDCSLNRDLHSCVEFYSSICRWLPKDHPLYPVRFGKATTKVMLSSYKRVYDPETGVCPSSKRIVQDITRCWGEHLDKICKEKGGAVPGLFRDSSGETEFGGGGSGKGGVRGLKSHGMHQISCIQTS